MALLDTLATELLGPKSLAQMAKSAEADSSQVQKLVTAALPILLSGMYQNASTEQGAQSLAKALQDHAPAAERSTSSMLKKVDQEDGAKIVSHILGSNEQTVVRDLSKATGLTRSKTSLLLALLAPILLSMLGSSQQSAAQQQVVYAQPQQQVVYTQPIQQQAQQQVVYTQQPQQQVVYTQQPQQQVVYTQPVQQQSSSSALMTSLLGSALLGNSYQQVQPAQQSGLNLMNVAGSLLGASSGGGLVDSLLGTSTQAAPAQQQSSGANLSSLLLGLLK